MLLFSGTITAEPLEVDQSLADCESISVWDNTTPNGSTWILAENETEAFYEQDPQSSKAVLAGYLQIWSTRWDDGDDDDDSGGCCG